MWGMWLQLVWFKRDYFKQPPVESPFQVVIDEKIQSDIFQRLIQPEQPSKPDVLPVPFDPSTVVKRPDKKRIKKDPKTDLPVIFIHSTSGDRVD